ncbi:MAG: hypothetical protein HYZ33_04570 [Ignavibacteriales bacterium]|nr:hypothetical protein [Ignavibacteriales bacterium]
MNFSYKCKTIITLVVMVFCFQEAHAQRSLYTVSINSSITTSSRLYYNPFDPDELLRNQSLLLSGVWGFGVDIRRGFENSNIQVGISAEYLWSQEEIVIPANPNNVITEDGFVAVPVEFSGYFSIPFSSESFRMYMGGGVGVYFGERQYTYAGIPSKVTERNPGIGIHVLSGFEFGLFPNVALRTELKFRDVQFDSTNVFPPQSITGSTIHPDEPPFASRMSIDGILFNLGLVYQF